MDLQDFFLYDKYTGLNALKTKECQEHSVGSETHVSALTYFVPTLTILRMSLLSCGNLPVRKSLCFSDA